MAQPFVGEIRMFAGNFAPAGWMFCAGQVMSIAENEVLFQLIGTTYGGDGESTFALPDLRGRLPLHVGPGYVQAQSGGVEAVTLTVNQIPAHSHVAFYSPSPGHLSEPAGAYPAAHRDFANFDSAPGTAMAATMAVAGGNQPHGNMPPFLCVNFIISLFGIFPQQN